MDRLGLAEQRYDQLMREEAQIPRAGHEPSATFVRNIHAWLKNDVAPAIEELWSRPKFQELAAWPQRHICSSTLEPIPQARRQVNAVADALQDEAGALWKLASIPAVASRLSEACPPTPYVVSEEVQIAAGRVPKVISRQIGSISMLPLVEERMKDIAKRSWTDLVCLADYFGPVGDMRGDAPDFDQSRATRSAGDTAKTTKRAKAQRSKNAASVLPVQPDLHPFFNPDLVPLGDQVTRGLMVRVDWYMGAIQEFRGYVQRAVAGAGSKDKHSRDVSREQLKWQELNRQYGSLQRICVDSDEMAKRDGAIALAQIYLALHPEREAHWLGLPPRLITEGTGWLKRQLTERCDRHTLQRLAAALGEIRKLLKNLTHEESAFDEALAKGGLLLCENPPEMYWDGKLIPVNWNKHRADWKFWLTLAKKALHGLPMGLADLYRASASSSALYSCKNRATSLVIDHASQLVKLIDRGPISLTYVLNLDRDQLSVLPRR